MAQVDSVHSMLIDPLERMGDCVDVFFLNRSLSHCGDSNESQFVGAYAAHLRGLWPVSHVSNQADDFRHALDHLMSHIASHPAPAYRTLIIMRHDIELVQPLLESKLVGPDIVLAGPAELKKWEPYQCVSDLLFVVPMGLLKVFSNSIGNDRAPRYDARGVGRCSCGCFSTHRVRMPVCAHQPYVGHDCYNELALDVGASNLSFMWPHYGWDPYDDKMRAYYKGMWKETNETKAAGHFHNCPQ